MTKVLQMTGSLGFFGIESVIMNFYRNIDRTQIQFDFVVSEDAGRFDDEVAAMGGKIFRLPSRSRHPFAYSKALIKIIKENGGYDIFHCNTNSAGCFVDMRAAKKAGIKIRIEHSHNSDCMMKIQHYLFKPFLKTVVTDRIACSVLAAEWMFGSADDCKILPNAIDLERYAFDENIRNEMRLKLDFSNNYVIGHIGSFQDRKNQALLVEALALTKTVNAKLVFVGTGETKEQVKNLAKERGVFDKIVFLENRNDINQLMNAFDVFAFPSKFEGLGVVTVEAQANGLPCILSDKVPAQALTDLCEIVPIDNGAELWAKAIDEFSFKARKNENDKLIEAGFDIKEQTKWLQNFYLEKCKLRDNCNKEK